MSNEESRRESILASLSDLLSTALAAVHTRVELLAVELHEESIRLAELVMLAAAVVALGILALGLITAAVVLLLSGNGRLVALALFAIGYLVAAGWAFRTLSMLLKSSAPFSGTLEELRKDRECLPGKSSHA